jgi:hypothetical protein
MFDVTRADQSGAKLDSAYPPSMVKLLLPGPYLSPSRAHVPSCNRQSD